MTREELKIKRAELKKNSEKATAKGYQGRPNVQLRQLYHIADGVKVLTYAEWKEEGRTPKRNVKGHLFWGAPVTAKSGNYSFYPVVIKYTESETKLTPITK